MLGRRTFIGDAAATLVAVALRAHGERNGAAPRIGFLTPGPNPREPAFWQGMRELGYVEDKSIVVIRRSAEGDLARLPDLAVQTVKERPEVIVAIASAAAIAAKQATSTIPIVVVGSSDPIATGLVGNPCNAERVAQLGLAHRLPVFSSSRVLTEGGNRASYGPDQAVLARRSAVYVQRILKAPSLAIFRSNSRRNSRSWSMPRLRRPWASPFRNRSCCARTASFNDLPDASGPAETLGERRGAHHAHVLGPRPLGLVALLQPGQQREHLTLHLSRA